jgi:hypothetical protein
VHHRDRQAGDCRAAQNIVRQPVEPADRGIDLRLGGLDGDLLGGGGHGLRAYRVFLISLCRRRQECERGGESRGADGRGIVGEQGVSFLSRGSRRVA